MSLVFITLGILALLWFVTASLSFISDPTRLDKEARDDVEAEFDWAHRY